MPVTRGSSFLCGPFQCLALPPGGQSLSSRAETTWGWQRQMLRREEGKLWPLVDAHGSLWGSLQVLFEQEYANLIQNQHFFFFFLALCSVDVQFGNWELGWCSSGSSGAEHRLHSCRLGGTEQCVNPLSGGTCVGVCSHPWTRSCGHRKRVVIPLLLMQ